MNARKILCIVGPTACHKTETAVLLAHALDGEIVSADSVQIYIGMDVGSAKPTVAEREGIPHHMLDCVRIDEPDCSVSRFRDMARAAIDDILARGRLPIVVGGSGLYMQAITNPLRFAVPSDAAVRQELSEAYDASAQETFDRLRACDPETASRLHIHDKKRIVRALEVFQCSGKPLSAYGNDLMNVSNAETEYNTACIGLNMDRAALHARIERRVESMLANGLLQEARALYDAGYDRTLPAMQSIGYQQLFRHFDGEITLEEATRLIQRDTRRFARRQLTWFRRDTRIRWIDVTQYDPATRESIISLAKELLET